MKLHSPPKTTPSNVASTRDKMFIYLYNSPLTISSKSSLSCIFKIEYKSATFTVYQHNEETYNRFFKDLENNFPKAQAHQAENCITIVCSNSANSKLLPTVKDTDSFNPPASTIVVNKR